MTKYVKDKGVCVFRRLGVNQENKLRGRPLYLEMQFTPHLIPKRPWFNNI